MKPSELFNYNDKRTSEETLKDFLKKVEECKESGHKKPEYFGYQPILGGKHKGKYYNTGICYHCSLPTSRIVDDLPDHLKNFKIGKSLQL